MKAASVTAAYTVLYAKLAETARANGYALAVHGTAARDFDLVAIPWSAAAVDALTLIKALKDVAGGCWHHPDPEVDKWFPDGSPTTKPHGRVAYSIHLTDRGADGPYLDVSVMPRLVTSP
jgi:hypothetical protein